LRSSARGRARADAQGRGDEGAGSGESIGNQPSGGEGAIRGFWFWMDNTFFGEVSEERRPWAIQARRRPGCFCSAYRLPFTVLAGEADGITDNAVFSWLVKRKFFIHWLFWRGADGFRTLPGATLGKRP
jgi:hypothetical protein